MQNKQHLRQREGVRRSQKCKACWSNGLSGPGPLSLGERRRRRTSARGKRKNQVVSVGNNGNTGKTLTRTGKLVILKQNSRMDLYAIHMHVCSERCCFSREKESQVNKICKCVS